ncbi:nucleoside deaminase [Nocardioides sp. GY 10127]|uniref:nucleoside deaminase n=1 Tax=Nocardioides sp. GY 10127 TaxID=2569762 RepID=UPI0010A7F928|nr:nucleoside deaminase [Nocardioides sp. GY 10127]TIC81685.1 nucleoside deaminase [Nocardioides sp. GY 10127]
MTLAHPDHPFLRTAVDLAVANVADGGGPFGALIVRDGEVVATGQNRVTRDLDPTAHAEVTAIRRACTVLDDFSLAGCTLYTSCEPCPLCLAAALWARVDRVVYAADRDDAARGGFDDRAFYELFASDRATWPTPVDLVGVAESFDPFHAWLSKDDRTHY